MHPIAWLEQRVPGFAALSYEERTAIQQFALLWSLFEGRTLRSEGSARQIMAVIHDGVSTGRIRIEPYEDCLEYFRNRYYEAGNFTHYYQQLKLRGNDNAPLVRAVLCRDNNDAADCISAILIVIYRFRNNLFHGQKWEYELAGQLANFKHANGVLMAAYDQLQDQQT
jgi:hypothetical protein